MGDHSIPKGHHGEGPALHDGGASKWDMKEALLNRAKVAGAPSAKGRATKVSKVGRGLPYSGVPNEDCYPELNALPQREPMEDIPRIGSNVVKFRYPPNQAGSRAQIAIQAVQASGRETNIKRTTVVKPGGDKRMDKGGCGSTGKRIRLLNILLANRHSGCRQLRRSK